MREEKKKRGKAGREHVEGRGGVERRDREEREQRGRSKYFNAHLTGEIQNCSFMSLSDILLTPHTNSPFLNFSFRGLPNLRLFCLTSLSDILFAVPL